MEDNLVRLLQGGIDERAVQALAHQLGHGEGEIGSALSVAIPTFVSGLAHKAMELGGASEVRSALEAADTGLLEDVPATFREERTRLMDEGSAILNLVFQEKVAGVQASVGAATGLGKGGAGSLMRMLAPVAMASIARHYRGRFGSDRDLARELAAEGALAEAFLPRSLGPLLAAETPRPARSPRPEKRGAPASHSRLGATHQTGGDKGRGGGPGRFLVPAAIGAAILAAILMFIGPRDRDASDPALLGRPSGDDGAGLVDDGARDMDRAGEVIRERSREAADEGRELGDEAGEAVREGGRAIERGADRVGERIREAWETTEDAVERGFEGDEQRREDLPGGDRDDEGGFVDDVRRGAEGLAEDAEEAGSEAADYLEDRRREIRFETARFFDAQELELNAASAEAVDEIAEEHAERESDRMTLRGPNPSQLDEIERALAERGITGVAKEIDASLDHIVVVFER